MDQLLIFFKPLRGFADYCYFTSTDILARVLEGAAAMRVISGKYRGRPLRSLRGSDTRPTSDRLRETLFNILTPGNPQALEGTVWLDLFAGTGAVGIEALSRGASHACFVETSPAAAEVIEQNLRNLEITSGFRILRDDLSGIIWRLQREHFVADVVFLDPPYHMQQAYESTLAALAHSSLIWAMSLVIAEHEKKFDPAGEFGSLRRIRKLVQGNTCLSFYKIGGQPDPPLRGTGSRGRKLLRDTPESQNDPGGGGVSHSGDSAQSPAHGETDSSRVVRRERCACKLRNPTDPRTPTSLCDRECDWQPMLSPKTVSFSTTSFSRSIQSQ